MISHVIAFFLFLFGISMPGQGLKGQVQGLETTHTETTASSSATHRITTGEVKNVSTLTGQRSEAFQAEILARRQKAVSEYQAKRTAFKATLAGIRETKKKEILTAIDARLAEINTNRTTMMMNRINSMSETLTNVSVRASGKGITSAEITDALAKADAAIGSAKAAITAQAGKEYVISITTNTDLQTPARTATSGLKSDLLAVYTSIKQAHDAVENVLRLVYAKYKAVYPVLTPSVSHPPEPTHSTTRTNEPG